MRNLVSVIVPVWNVQGYLGECLDSLLLHPTAVEVIGVDDASPDHGGEILDERAAADPRLIVLHLPSTVGPGPARNAGLERASGEYVWFVDGDDRIVPGALAAVEAALLADKPDVLIVGTARERWNRSVSRWTTPAAEPGGAAALTRPLPPLGALIVRQAFLAESGIEFRSGWHEDVGFVASVLARTDRVSAYDPACYVHRPDRPGSIRTRRSARHADLVDQLDHVVSLTDTAPKLRRQALHLAIEEVLRLLRDEKRLPKGARADVFGKLSKLVRAHGGGAGVRQRLIAAGSFPAYRMICGTRDGLAAVARRGRGFVRSRRNKLRKRGLRWYYRWQLRRPLDDNLAVYAAYWYRGYACNPAAVYEKARELAPSVRGVWVVKKGAGPLPAGVPGVVAGTRPYYRALARAKYLVNNATFPPEVVKRPGAIHVQTHHGTPLKTMGLDQPRFPASLGKFNPERLRRDIAKWDFSVTANRHTTLLWERQFPIKGETLESGYPRNDRLARAGADETAAARAELGIAPGERVILYAPTHREWHPAFTPVLDVDALAEALGENTRLLMRGHYFYRGVGIPPRSPQVVDVSTFPSVETLMIASDAMMTDFSSIMFDYAVLDRPLVIYAPDWEIYRAVRGVTFDLPAEHPGTFVRSFDEVIEAFRSGAVSGPEAAAHRARFRERFCSLEDGHAAERVVRRVFLGDKPEGARRHG
jgi:CDP-glycerol glycerophosphotransferase